jgi:hypothetical protein
MRKRSQASPSNPRVEEPVAGKEQQRHDEHREERQQRVDQEAVCDDEDEDEDEQLAEDSNRFLHPSAIPPPPPPPNSIPGTKKIQHRNIFKRLIRRKSEGTLSASASDADRHQLKLSPSSPPPSSSLYMNQASSYSQSSIMSNATTSTSLSLPSLHQYHKEQQQQLFGGFAPGEIEYKQHSSTQVPDHNPDLARTRAQSSEAPLVSSFGSKGSPSSSSSSVMEETATKIKTRPRSSTVHSFSLSRA